MNEGDHVHKPVEASAMPSDDKRLLTNIEDSQEATYLGHEGLRLACTITSITGTTVSPQHSYTVTQEHRRGGLMSTGELPSQYEHKVCLMFISGRDILIRPCGVRPQEALD